MRLDFRRAAAFGFALACIAGIAQADWKRNYDLGIRAVEQQEWQEAEARFRAAIKQDDTPNERKRFEGMRFAPYVPQYYAGLAAWRRGNCSDALDYWQQAANLSTIGKLPDLKAEQERGVQACQQQLAAASAAVTTSTAAADPPSTTPPISPPSTNPASTSPATTAPTGANGAATKPPAKPPAAPVVAARPTPPAPTPVRPAPTERVSAPAALGSAVALYLSGRYPELARTDPAAVGDSRARAQLLMLRAAGRFLQLELDGKSGADFDPAVSDVRAAKAANSALSPDAAMFPPRFRSFWQKTR